MTCRPTWTRSGTADRGPASRGYCLVRLPLAAGPAAPVNLNSSEPDRPGCSVTIPSAQVCRPTVIPWRMVSVPSVTDTSPQPGAGERRAGVADGTGVSALGEVDAHAEDVGLLAGLSRPGPGQGRQDCGRRRSLRRACRAGAAVLQHVDPNSDREHAGSDPKNPPDRPGPAGRRIGRPVGRRRRRPVRRADGPA